MLYEVITIFLFSVIIQAILSWFQSGGYNPVYALLNSLTAPVLRPARKILPPTSKNDGRRNTGQSVLSLNVTKIDRKFSGT